MTQAQRFLHLYNQLDTHLREITGLTDRSSHSFRHVLEQAARRNSAIAHYRGRIRSFIELRNAIVHESRYAPDIIAEPHPQAVDDFERWVGNIMNPERVDSIGSPLGEVFRPSAPLAEALRHMQEGDFSQVVVRGDTGELSLLTTEGVARWIEHHVADEIIELKGVPIQAVLEHEQTGTFEVIRRQRSVHDARRTFERPFHRSGARLFALLVTQNGRPNEAPLRIITPWDMLQDE